MATATTTAADRAATKAAKAQKAAQQRTRKARETAILLKQDSDPTRLQILLMLAEGERHVGAICDALGDQSQPAVSHHLALLRHGSIVTPRREGKTLVYS